jgi:hypothetical protein
MPAEWFSGRFPCLFLKPLGETRLGIGHHKVGFSMKRPRLAVSNIADCSDVVSVYDYQNPSDIKLIKTFSAADLGYDGSTPLKTCDFNVSFTPEEMKGTVFYNYEHR